MKIRKNFVRFALALALVISMMAAMSVGAFAEPSAYPNGGNLVWVYATTGGSATATDGSASATSGSDVYWMDAIVSGTVITVTVAPETGYKFSSLSVKEGQNDIAFAAGTEANTYTFAMPSNSVVITASFEKLSAELDSTTTTQTVAQNYDLTLSGGSYTDVTKVKVEWSTTDISATRTDNKTWNPGTLSWDDTTSTNTVTVSQNGGATFTLTNLSSVSENATVTFAQVTGFSAPTVVYTEDGTTGDGTTGDGAAAIGTVVNSDKTVTADNDHDTVIGVTVTPVASDFKALGAASDAQYGTYTVTIGAVS